jgi:ATP-dependent RNA helicase DeaD
MYEVMRSTRTKKPETNDEAQEGEAVFESLPPSAVVALDAPAAPETPLTGPDAVTTEANAEEPPKPEAEGFRVLNLSEPVMRAVIEAGFEAPTPIQEQAIPILLAGHDLIGQAQTGTGKTAAFALPLAERLDPTARYPQAIILLPTRELCIQVAQETHNLSKHRKLKVVPVYGGQPIDRQFRALGQGAQIVVGTPGRVLDHLRRGTLDLSHIRMVVLDEADEMLNMGFLEDVEEILKEAPKERQTALFSATIPPRIAALARDYLRAPQRVSIESKKRTVAQITQTYYEVLPAQKVEALARILDHETPGSTIIFCRTRRDVDELGEALQMRGYEAETLHGEMNQAARDRVMNRFRAGQADLLIATDVAARGLDIDQVTHVINYDIPWDVESYIHRVGRTGRAGRAGEAITLVSPRERYQLRQIERFINAPILPARVPTAADIAARRREMFKDRLRQTLAESNYDGYLVTVEELAAEGEFDASQIAAAALQMIWQAQKGAADYDITEVEVETERAEPGMTRLFLQIGRQDGVRPGDIVGAIANEAGIPGNAIGAIDIMDRSTFVEVPEGDAQRVMDALSRAKLRGKRLYVDIARPRSDFEPEHRGSGDGRRGGERDRFGKGGRDRDAGTSRASRWPDRPPRPRPPSGRRDEPPRRRR